MMNDKEQWRPVAGFENEYLVSSNGRLKSLSRNGTTKADKIIKPNTNGRYARVGLHKNGARKDYSLHRLIAMAFVPNPNNLPQVDHINGNAYDNHVENLRWVTAKQNINNPITLKRHNDKMWELRKNDRCKAVQQFALDGTLLHTYISIREAERETGIHKANISAAAKAKRRWVTDHFAIIRSAGGYKWKFV